MTRDEFASLVALKLGLQSKPLNIHFPSEYVFFASPSQYLFVVRILEDTETPSGWSVSDTKVAINFKTVGKGVNCDIAEAAAFQDIL